METKEYTKEEHYYYARKFMLEGDLDNSLGHYVLLHSEDSENDEAKFFFAYYAFLRYLETRELDIKGIVKSLSESVCNAVKYVKASETDEEEKLNILVSIVEIYISVLDKIMGYRIPTSQSIILDYIVKYYALGDTIEKEFEGSYEAMEEAKKAWKKGIAWQNKFWLNKYEGINQEEYIAKLKKLEPSYNPKTPIIKKIVDKIKKLFKKG